MPFQAQLPFPPRRASQTLRDQLVAYLRHNPDPVGTPFYSDSDLTELSGLSRKTVRRALDEMHRDGWIVRQAGKGSFVGPRVATPMAQRSQSTGPTLVRLAVLAYGMDRATPDWYSQAVLHGLDEVAAEQAISIELLGQNASDAKVLARRLAQSVPDVLAVMPSTLHHALLLGEAQRLGIPCVLTGTRLSSLGLPTVYEDGRQGAADAVKYLAAQGHRRIGLMLRMDPAPYVFQRRTGYVEGLEQVGIEPDARLLHWQPMEESAAPDADALMLYLEKNRPTALLLGSGMCAQTLGALTRSGRLSIPRDLSVVTFDQNYGFYQLHLGMKPTTVELPLQAMGRELGIMARSVFEKTSVPARAALPCELVDGESVARCKN